MKKFSPENLVDIVAMYKTKVAALVPVAHGNLWAVGVAVANERGFNPLPASWCHAEMSADAFDEIADYLETVNSELFNLDDDTAARIVASTMVGG